MSRRPFLRETPYEKFFRYRGVILVVSMPVLLILLVVGLMPRAQHPDDHLQTHIDVNEGTIPDTRYAVVFDAGSTGSRVHIFRFKSSSKGYILLDDTFEQLKPGLSSFAADPKKGAASLSPLIERALQTVPKEARSITTLELRATAGLRLLPDDQSENLLQAVRDILSATPFLFDSTESATIMDGADEGAFQWLSINYLLGNLGGTPSGTVAAVDLGGGSVQMAFALPQNKAASAPKGFVRGLRGGGATYHVYVHSYLGYGLMAARAAILGAVGPSDSHPCIANGHNGSYVYGGSTVGVHANENSDFERCATTSESILNKDKACEVVPNTECSFNGIWGGGDVQKSIYVSSYFWDRAEQSGIISGPNAISETVNPVLFGKMAQEACGVSSVSEVTEKYASVDAKDVPYFCMDLVYCHTLLSKGFEVGPDTEMTLVKRISYNGNEIEAAWPLGAAINALG
mmetsp:Transcript_26624/g.36754  ORF Transcript_26624/g.36754 Transcript_26624/m.36754 type:complete len:459 (+) Transcript_26624:153-1529(+)|eukprot:CAMPEP_0196590242 /NCGR_PEP_ID=MMETSP1081-20130531/66051_1 /TAXON_ID=36882 /ORGANISM="Pyramimonas amylifera, Strain CCMP720" /LENGTH=458 /DNA_ID=CAMNT_0041913293 /DNA_START=164 /DNA_END=1540 /DNA_ORIENTATION=+